MGKMLAIAQVGKIILQKGTEWLSDDVLSTCEGIKHFVDTQVLPMGKWASDSAHVCALAV